MTLPQAARPRPGFSAGDTLQLPVLAERRPAADVGPPRERWEGIGFRPDIQGLRAIAVVLVLLSHAGFGYVAGGYVGVDVFFVLSGFLITSLLIKEVFDTGRISIAGFYARRARRILPAATAVTIVTVAAAWLWLPVTRLESAMQDAIAVIAYYINYRFVSESTEYLNADAMPSPFQQYWSLAVEEQFYVVWPLLLLMVLLAARRRARATLKVAVVLCVLIFAASLAASVLITESSRPTAYFAAHTRAWELAGGAFLALTLPMWKRLPRAVAIMFGLAGLAAIAAAGLRYTEATPFPGYTALVPVVGTMLVIAGGGARGGPPLSSLLSTVPFQFFGKISYSLYLWHWPVLILGPLALGVEPSLLLNVVLLTGTVTIAMFSYQYIEEPFRNAKLIKAGNFRGLAAGAVCTAAAVAVILAATMVFSKVPEDDGVDLTAVEQVPPSELEQRLLDGLEIQSVPENLTPSLANINEDRPSAYRDGCHLDFEGLEAPAECAFGDPDSDTTVMLIGDSHAAQWFPALEVIAEERGWALLMRTKSACTPVSVRVRNLLSGGEYTQCWEWRQRLFDEIDSIEPDLVVVGAEEAAKLLDVPESEDTAAWREGWDETLARLTASAGEVATLADIPWSSGDAAPDCLAVHMDAVRECVENHSYRVIREERRAAGAEATEAAGAHRIETSSFFCVDQGCPLIVGDVLVYRDKHHMTTAYSVSLSGVLADALPMPA